MDLVVTLTTTARSSKQPRKGWNMVADTDKEVDRTPEKRAWTPEGKSIALAFATMVLMPGWLIATITRTVFTQEIVTPVWWFTSAFTIWIPFIIFAIQMWLLANATLYSTRKEAAGTYDMDVSNYTFTVTAGTVLIWWLLAGLYYMKWSTINVPMSWNHFNGQMAFVLTTFVESKVTNRVWTVANRRPGGTIST